jgi:hypothetical protein
MRHSSGFALKIQGGRGVCLTLWHVRERMS